MQLKAAQTNGESERERLREEALEEERRKLVKEEEEDRKRAEKERLRREEEAKDELRRQEVAAEEVRQILSFVDLLSQAESAKGDGPSAFMGEMRADERTL